MGNKTRQRGEYILTPSTPPQSYSPFETFLSIGITHFIYPSSCKLFFFFFLLWCNLTRQRIKYFLYFKINRVASTKFIESKYYIYDKKYIYCEQVVNIHHVSPVKKKKPYVLTHCKGFFYFFNFVEIFYFACLFLKHTQWFFFFYLHN